MTGPIVPPAAEALALQTLAQFGRLKLRVTGTSMLPALRPGDVIEFHAGASQEAGAGEIVLCQRDAGLVVHRVLARTSTSVITQGDSLAAPDSAVALSDVLGRAVGLSRGNRQLPGKQLVRPGPRLVRWWFRRFDLATRLFLHWNRISARIAA